MAVAGIYALVNILNGKRYIGSTVNLNERYRYHVWSLKRGEHHCLPLQRAWNKYGDDSFRFEVLKTIEDDRNVSDLRSLEQVYLDSCANLYNVATQANSPAARGKPFTARHRARISAALTGRKLSASHVEKSRLGNRGKVVSIDTRRKIGAAHRGKAISANHRDALRNALTGKASTESVELRAEIACRLWSDPLWRARNLAARKNSRCR